MCWPLHPTDPTASLPTPLYPPTRPHPINHSLVVASPPLPIQVGTGPFQWMLLAVCGLANAADAVEILSVGLLGTAAEAELQLTPKRTGALNACIFVGMFLVRGNGHA